MQSPLDAAYKELGSTELVHPSPHPPFAGPSFPLPGSIGVWRNRYDWTTSQKEYPLPSPLYRLMGGEMVSCFGWFSNLGTKEVIWTDASSWGVIRETGRRGG